MAATERLLAILLTAAFLLAAGRAWAAGGDCRAVGGAEVEVALVGDAGGVALDNRLQRADLHRLSGGQGPSGRGWHTSGLTMMEMNFALRIGVMVYPMGGGRFCVDLTSVQARLGFADFKVHVERSYVPGSCPYQVVLAHEMRHVALYRQELDAALPRVRGALEEAARALPPVSSRDPDAATRNLSQALERRVRPLLDRLEKDMRDANQAIDTEAAYRAEQAKCAKW